MLNVTKYLLDNNGNFQKLCEEFKLRIKEHPNFAVLRHG
jgi:hypothetical protein